MEIGNLNQLQKGQEDILKKKLKNRVFEDLYELVKKNDKGLTRKKDLWGHAIVAEIGLNGP